MTSTTPASACSSRPPATCHLAHGLLDHAQHIIGLSDDEAADAAIAEARGIAGRLRCQPLPDYAHITQPASPSTAAAS